MAEIRPNIVKRKLQLGEPVNVLAGYMDPDLAEIFGNLGFDGVWIEAEHGSFDYRDIPDMTRACDLWDMTSIVRVNLNLPGVIYRTLDQGAQGIVVPHVNTADEARAVVDACKFYPIGARGMFGSRQAIGVNDFLEKVNDEVLVIVLIEDIVAIDNLDDILKVDNIDVFFVAGSDLGQSMGHLEEHPETAKVIDDANRKIVASGRNAGASVTDDNVDLYLDQGVTFLMSDWDGWLEKGAKAYLNRVSTAFA